MSFLKEELLLHSLEVLKQPGQVTSNTWKGRKQVPRIAFCRCCMGPAKGRKVFASCLDLETCEKRFPSAWLVPGAQLQGRPELDSSEVLTSRLEG